MTGIPRALNGYTIPTAVVAVLVSLAGFGWMNACSRINALEVDAATGRTWRAAQEEAAATQRLQQATMAVAIDRIGGDVLVLKDRSDHEERRKWESSFRDRGGR